jgi:methionyl-tRNA formyltransferase
MEASVVKQFAQENGIDVLQPDTPNTPEFREKIMAYQADVMVVAAYGKILQKKLLALSPHGYINVHYSILPKYRGASPVTQAILDGETTTGVTIMKMVREMDAGPILLQKEVAISASDTTGSLQEKLSQTAAPMVLETLKDCENLGREQEEEDASFCYILKKGDGNIIWNKPATYIERFIRAMQPWPKAFSYLPIGDSYHRVILHQVKVLSRQSSKAPGTILLEGNDFLVNTSDFMVQIIKIQKAGKPIMEADVFLRGNRLQSETVFTSQEK